MPQQQGKRSSVKVGRAKTHAKSKKKSQASARRSLTAAQLLQQAQAALAFERYDAALECMHEALELEPENVDVLDAHGALLAELGQAEQAVQELQKAVMLSPDEGFEKYMYLGQLLQGEQALAAAQKGVELLQRDVERSKAAPGAAAAAATQRLSKQLAAAVCSLAEMKLAAAAEVSEVSAEADALLQQARAADPSSPEPLQILASLRYEQGHADEALSLLKQSMGLWFRPQDQSADGDDDADDDDDEEEDEEQQQEAAEGSDDFQMPVKPVTLSEEEMETEPHDAAAGAAAAAAGSSDDADVANDDNDEEESDEDDDDVMPSYEFRFESAKMLLELDHTTETAIQVLEDLIAENDSVPDVWHLLGLAYYSGGMLVEASEVCKAGMDLLHKQRPGPDEEVLASFQDLQSAIQEALEQQQQEPAAAVGGAARDH